MGEEKEEEVSQWNDDDTIKDQVAYLQQTFQSAFLHHNVNPKGAPYIAMVFYDLPSFNILLASKYIHKNGIFFLFYLLTICLGIVFFLTLDLDEHAKLESHIANSVFSITFRYCVQINKVPKAFKIPRTKYHQHANVIYVSILFNDAQGGRPAITLDSYPQLSKASFTATLVDNRESLLVIIHL
jgi:hypothetical protein